MIIRVKNHHMPPMIRVDSALGISSEPGVGDGEGEGGKRKQREKGHILYIHILYTYVKRIRFHCQNCNSYIISVSKLFLRQIIQTSCMQGNRWGFCSMCRKTLSFYC